MLKKTLLLVILLGLSNTVFATEIKQIQTSLQDHRYVLSAEIDYQLSDKAKEALINGVSLFWTLHIRIQQQRDLLWSITLLDKDIHYHLQYHALLNMYRVDIRQADSEKTESYNFSTLSAALDLMATVRNVQLLEQSTLEKEHEYFIKVKAEFDRDALPLPLRPIAYTNPQWYLSSDWMICNIAVCNNSKL